MFKDDNTSDGGREIQEGGRSRRRWPSRSGVALLAALLLPLLGSCLRYHNKADFCEQDDQCGGGSCDPRTKRCVSPDAGAGGAGGAPGDGGFDMVTTGCSKKADCAATPSTPVCDLTSRKCVGCLAPADCSGAKLLCDTTAKTCVACLASTDCHAPTPACDPGTHACVPCLAKADCLGTPATSVCDTTTKTCVACVGNTDCAGAPATPVCDPMAHVCVGCVGRTDCATPKPACDTTAKMCVGCLAKTDCAAPTATCDTTAKMCVGCLARTDCAAPTPACDTTAKSCVGCLARTDCAAPTPACDTAAKACVGCLATSDCGGSKPLCDTTAKSCVQCLSNSDCGGGTPICDAHVCRSCRDDADCVTNFGANPGVCMSHQDRRCATDAETIYVQNIVGTCSVTATTGGTSTVPFCSMEPAVAAVGTGATKAIVVVRGGVSGASGAFSPSVKQLSVIGQNTGIVGAVTVPAFHLAAGDAFLRDLKLGPSSSLGAQADPGSILRLQHTVVTGNSSGGILLDGASFDIRNTTITNNGPGTIGPVQWGGVFAKDTPVGGPKQLQLVTIQGNMQIGVTCSAAISGSGILATPNVGGEINATCAVIACSPASATCGAQP